MKESELSERRAWLGEFFMSEQHAFIHFYKCTDMINSSIDTCCVVMCGWPFCLFFLCWLGASSSLPHIPILNLPMYSDNLC